MLLTCSCDISLDAFDEQELICYLSSKLEPPKGSAPLSSWPWSTHFPLSTDLALDLVSDSHSNDQSDRAAERINLMSISSRWTCRLSKHRGVAVECECQAAYTLFQFRRLTAGFDADIRNDIGIQYAICTRNGDTGC